jgi:hypothetical protein
MSDSAVLLVLKLKNESPDMKSSSIVYGGNLAVDGWDLDSPCCDLDGRGFLMQGHRYAFSLICKSCPLFRDVAKYWFGSLSDLQNNHWDQIPTGSFSRLDHGCAWSWDLEIPPNGFATVGVLIKSGPYVSDAPSFALTVPPTALTTEALVVKATVSDTGPGPVELFVVFDSDLSEIRTVWQGSPSDSFEVSVSHSLSPGNHDISFYAVSTGRVSGSGTNEIAILSPASESPVATPTMSPVETQSQSLTASIRMTSTAELLISQRLFNSEKFLGTGHLKSRIVDISIVFVGSVSLISLDQTVISAYFQSTYRMEESRFIGENWAGIQSGLPISVVFVSFEARRASQLGLSNQILLSNHIARSSVLVSSTAFPLSGHLLLAFSCRHLISSSHFVISFFFFQGFCE